MAAVKCSQCEAEIDELAVFPKGRCVDCYAASPEGRRMPTAAEVRRTWGVR